MHKLHLKANAKINLALAVKFRRSDGFHEIESLFQEIEYGDDIIIEKANQIQFSTTSELIPDDNDNLCVRAARLMQKNYPFPGAKIYLDKKIPIGAGLGGGSSDAAAVLCGLNRIYELNLDQQVLMNLAGQLGSDVPFFISGGAAYVTGRGEKIQPVQIDRQYLIVLIMPPLAVATAWAYKNLNLTLTKKLQGDKFIGFKFQDLTVSRFNSEYYNDFEHTVFAAYPELLAIKDALYQRGAVYAAMSGSGSALFGLFADQESAGQAMKSFANKYNCVLTKPVAKSRQFYLGA